MYLRIYHIFIRIEENENYEYRTVKWQGVDEYYNSDETSDDIE